MLWHVGRKGRNMKTGSLMPEWYKGLLVALHGGSKGASSSSAGGATLPVQADQPMGEKPCLHKAPPAEVEEADEEVMLTQASVITLKSFCSSSLASKWPPMAWTGLVWGWMAQPTVSMGVAARWMAATCLACAHHTTLCNPVLGLATMKGSGWLRFP